MTCRSADSNPLLLSFAQSIAAQVERAMMDFVSSREIALLRDYLSACRHATGPILALNNEVVMMNRHAQQQLAPDDRAALLARTADSSDLADPGTLVADLPSGLCVRMDYRPTFYADELVGGVFRVQLNDPRGHPARSPARRAQALPGLAGTSAEWVRAIAQLRERRRGSEWTVIEGEVGVGKLSLATAAHHDLALGEHLRVLDATAIEDEDAFLTELEGELTEGNGSLIIRRIERLPRLILGPMSELLVEHGERGAAADHWVVATRNSDVEYLELDSTIIPCFGHSVVVPPLRHRPEDIRAIAPALLREIGRSEGLAFAPDALRHLTRLPWTGNVSALRAVIQKIIRQKRTGVIEVRDLPPECQSSTRRSLTPLESLERDAIVNSLRDHGGNKADAAEHLGMSRATIYRKIRDYGIQTG